jgi:adenine-specific DNA-methyltransferase
MQKVIFCHGNNLYFEKHRLFPKQNRGWLLLVFFGDLSHILDPERSKTHNYSITESSLMPVGTFNINNRRYLGNKFKLLDFIKTVVNDSCRNVKVVADLFAGTGAVAYGFAKNKTVITNDILYSNFICNYAWLSPEEYRKDLISQIIIDYNNAAVRSPNYMSRNFADTYFSKKDCRKIGFIREDIERKFKTGEINFKEKAILIMSLIYAMDRIAKTCGHYDAYRQNVEFDENLELKIPCLPQKVREGNRCFNEDINKLVRQVKCDLLYLDPPYNSRQYCDAYHLLENVARWQKPKLDGVAKKMDRSNLKSDYCTQKAVKAFEDLVLNANTRYILLSYNNMMEKGNSRSNAKIDDADIVRILQKKGEVQIFEQNYKAFSTGKSDIQDNKERLFLCTCV